MAEALQISILPDEIVRERVSANLMVPMEDAPGLQAVHCGDIRAQTPASFAMQSMVLEKSVTPGRIFGGGLGIVEASLITVAAQHGPKGLNEIREGLGPNFRGEMLAHIASRAFEWDELLITVHSAMANEGHDHAIVTSNEARLNDLGCAFATYLGQISKKAAKTSIQSCGELLLSELGLTLPLDDANQGIKVIQNDPAPPLKFSRQDLQSIRRSNKFVPVAILQDTESIDQRGIVIDLKGYRSDPAAHIDRRLPRYHTTPQLGELGAKYWDKDLDREILMAASFLLGMGTAEQLQTPQKKLPIEVIAS